MAISFKEVGYYYKQLKTKYTALENINLEISDKGEFIAITGHTGSGKTTLVQHMNALLIPSSGVVEIFDTKIDSKKRRKPKLNNCRRQVGLVFQFPEYQLFSETVIKDIMFGPKNYKELYKNASNLALDAARLVKIDETLFDKSPFKISGGEQRKCAIAGILAMDPKIIVLDEPTRGLDPLSQKEIMDTFKEISKTTNKTIILITHDMDIIAKYANRVIVVNDTKITYDGNLENLFYTDVYKNNHLELPSVLKIVKHLNENMKINLNKTLDYNNLVNQIKDIDK